MNGIIRSLHTWLQRQYEILGQGLTDQPEPGQPLWHTDTALPNQAQLLDAEVGVWMRFFVLTDAARASEAVEDAVRIALDDVSRLDPRSNTTVADPIDRPWQVHVFWLLTPGEVGSAWRHAMAHLRSRGGHSEEIGLDGLQAVAGDVDEALQRHGVPALLFRSRALLRLEKAQLPRWLSPDEQFAERLRAVPVSIADAATRELATAFVAQMLTKPKPDHGSAPSNPLPAFGKLAVSNFRNIVEGELHPQHGQVSVEVIFGPNGTGKSSLFEALSLAMFGTSLRLRNYFEDKDVSAKLQKEYVTAVLRRFDAQPGQRTVLTLDGHDRLALIAATGLEARERYFGATGTLLPQEEARAFVVQSAGERAARVLGDYSWLARATQDEIEGRLNAVTEAWQEWLRGLGLNAAITKRATVLSRAADQLLKDKVPPGSDEIGEWLRALGTVRPEMKDESDAAGLRWARLDSPDGRSNLVSSFATERGIAPSARAQIIDWMQQRSDALDAIERLARSADTSLQRVKQEWPRITADVEAWATWIERQRRKSAPNAPAPIPQTEGTLAQLSDEVLTATTSSLAKTGQLLRQRLEHFDELKKQFLPAWQEAHPDRCPTCDQLHEAEGIAAVVTRLRASVEDELRQSRERYASLQAESRRRQGLRAGAGQPPIDGDRQAELARLLWLPSEGVDSLGQRLTSNPGAWRSVVSPMQRLLAGPALPDRIDTEAAESRANALMQSLVTQDEQGENKREAPERWKRLKKSIDDAAREVVARHLPGTLEAVWLEIALALAPARWNQISYGMKLDQQRGATRLGIVTQRQGSSADEIPVVHVLNQAEQHVLGLAWFLTRHLVHGRFLTPLMVLDDPAQEMDQVTYRRFVRVLQSLVRMHEKTARPLQLLVMLHQEDRALELARAISKDGELTMLAWAREMHASGPETTVTSMKLRNPEQRAPLPEPLRPQARSTIGVAH